MDGANVGNFAAASVCFVDNATAPASIALAGTASNQCTNSNVFNHKG
ncbi:hypothetical protein [Streptomyces sp. NPDC005244]